MAMTKETSTQANSINLTNKNLSNNDKVVKKIAAELAKSLLGQDKKIWLIENKEDEKKFKEYKEKAEKDLKSLINADIKIRIKYKANNEKEIDFWEMSFDKSKKEFKEDKFEKVKWTMQALHTLKEKSQRTVQENKAKELTEKIKNSTEAQTMLSIRKRWALQRIWMNFTKKKWILKYENALRDSIDPKKWTIDYQKFISNLMYKMNRSFRFRKLNAIKWMFWYDGLLDKIWKKILTKTYGNDGNDTNFNHLFTDNQKNKFSKYLEKLKDDLKSVKKEEDAKDTKDFGLIAEVDLYLDMLSKAETGLKAEKIEVSSYNYTNAA